MNWRQWTATLFRTPAQAGNAAAGPLDADSSPARVSLAAPPFPGLVYLLLPAYNEASALASLIPEAKAMFEQHHLKHRIIVCDDGSQDGTGTVAETLGAEVLWHLNNLGLAEATESLLSHVANHLQHEADGVVVMMDADCTMSPWTIPSMLTAMQEQQCDVVIASRFRLGARVDGLSVQRRLYSRLCSWLFQLFKPIRGVRDYTCGFRAIRGQTLMRAMVWSERQEWLEGAGFTAGTRLLLRLGESGADCTEVPLHLHYDRKPGASKMKVGETMRGYLKLLTSKPASD